MLVGFFSDFFGFPKSWWIVLAGVVAGLSHILIIFEAEPFFWGQQILQVHYYYYFFFACFVFDFFFRNFANPPNPSGCGSGYVAGGQFVVPESGIWSGAGRGFDGNSGQCGVFGILSGGSVSFSESAESGIGLSRGLFNLGFCAFGNLLLGWSGLCSGFRLAQCPCNETSDGKRRGSMNQIKRIYFIGNQKKKRKKKKKRKRKSKKKKINIPPDKLYNPKHASPVSCPSCFAQYFSWTRCSSSSSFRPA
jgi:hypothetical protein